MTFKYALTVGTDFILGCFDTASNQILFFQIFHNRKRGSVRPGHCPSFFIPYWIQTVQSFCNQAFLPF